MAQIQANGITVEYETTGSGDPLLLVMGLGGQLTDWPPDFVDILADRGFQVITFDNRDIGLSTEFDWEPPSQVKTVLGNMVGRIPDAEYDLTDMAADGAGLLAALDVGPAHVVGMSMGGMIAQQMAIDHAGSVRSLTSIMSNTGDNKRGRPSKKLIAKFARFPVPTRETAVEDSVRNFSLFSGPHFDADVHRQRAEVSVARSFRPVGVARQTAAIMASPDRTPMLSSLDTPTLVIHGLLDPLVMPSGGIATAAAVPDSRLVLYPDMGHDLPRPRWDEIADTVAHNAQRA